MQTSYNKLCTEFYDYTKPEATKAEVDFYAQKLQLLSGSFLEAMCGSGRLLLPLLKRGIAIEGVDYSAAMLKSCKNRATQQNLSPLLYQQNILELSLSKQYAAIIIAYGSFQLLTQKDAVQALKQLHNHLQPGGLLLLDTFIPWDCIQKNQREYITARTIHLTKNTQITLTTTSTFDLDKQMCHDHSLYQKFQDNHLTETEHEDISITWYYDNELELLLQTTGFSSITKEKISFYPDSTLYTART